MSQLPVLAIRLSITSCCTLRRLFCWPMPCEPSVKTATWVELMAMSPMRGVETRTQSPEDRYAAVVDPPGGEMPVSSSPLPRKLEQSEWPLAHRCDSLQRSPACVFSDVIRAEGRRSFLGTLASR